MKRRILAVVLLILVLGASAAPALAFEIGPMAAVSVDGGLVHSTGTKYILWSSADGAYEFKSTSATLYRQSGSSWVYITTVYAEGYDYEIIAEKNVTISTSGYYKVNLTATSSSGTATRTRYYTI